MLFEAGVPFAFTTQGLKEPADLWVNLRRMVLSGLDSVAAIAALTIEPARMFPQSTTVAEHWNPASSPAS
jgi:imidazolonepropionase-like amidohydrolase